MSRLSDTNSCLLTAKMDFGFTTGANKWNTQQELYRLNALRMDNASNVEDDYGFSVIETKSKIRGHGKAIVLRFESSPGKDFELLGWGVPFEAPRQE